MRILVVEDEKEIAQSLKKTLEAECFTVDLAHDGEEGSFLARVNDYDLIILDINLPKKEGLEVCRDIRDSGKMVPILIVSVRSETINKVDLLNAGADDYLTKPFSVDELIARVKALLRRPREIKDDIIKVDGLIIDLKKHIVTRSGKEIYFTRKEFMLLEYLMRNEGVILSRAMIMEHVWDMHVDPFSTTIESHIASLRRKIDIKGVKKLIHTVPGMGYVMDDRK